MKFKNFVKQLGGEGTIYESPNGDKWLGGIVGTFTMMKIPSSNAGIIAKNIKKLNTDVVGATTDEPDCDCKLTSARLEHPDDRAGEILRTFSSPQGNVEIKNKQFGLIERYNSTGLYKVNVENNVNVNILQIVKQIGSDIEIEGIMFDYMFMKRGDWSLWQ